ncbi:FAD-binding protein [Sphingobacterium shayense]|uniref:FAD-binding and (Fe-S)-binding domain-containing protein n=1 Tax=Sphingobacterium shayense TaxID=626343 RepID=UPI001556F0AC|nr:FAD-binding and (Fe-S)-binding domain-containing protein [Sphingobacterium shayense]NQD69945.1 FAD-binding protein [Sphingobacterium shayense]
MRRALEELAIRLAGELYWDEPMRTLYATDASAYRQMPLAVSIPKNADDLRTLIQFANRHKVSLIPRTAGTSLAGQVVGEGIVVDVSRYFTKIIELNVQEGWVRVEPGVIRDELNMYLAQYGLYFGPETSTANRAMIGGMVGNNSCGSNSLLYQSTREHTLELSVLLSDGSQVNFSALNFDDFIRKCELDSREGTLYRHIRSLLSDFQNQTQIRLEFPKKSIPRRNTGYALDLLLDSDPFTAGAEAFNFCKLLCGSEGTLGIITEIKLRVLPKPVNPTGLLCVHFHSVHEALRANLIALEHKPLVCELMDHHILERTKDNLEQRNNRFFVAGNPAAILIVEYDGEDIIALQSKAATVEQDMRSMGLGYHFPLVTGAQKRQVWNLRKAGLGLLSNIPGDAKPASVVEDTAVDVQDLPEYIAEFDALLEKKGLYSVHYAHAATGELHLRPILNLKTAEGRVQFRKVAIDIARLVKKYQGSLSGEHGDGRLRGEFISMMIGEHNYGLLKDIKRTWDPNGIFNPGKIVDSPPMDSFLRYELAPKRPIRSVYRYGGQNILQHIEQCNGSGDCRKSHLSGGTMCPSYMATREEKDTTRARANMLREILYTSEKQNPFDHPHLKEVLDLCISCKGCKSECPSSVDMAKLKGDFQQAYYKANGVPFRSWIIANIDRVNAFIMPIAPLYNIFVRMDWSSRLINYLVGFASERKLPELSRITLRRWFSNRTIMPVGDRQKKVFLFIDEFSNYNEVEIGKMAVKLLERLGFQVHLTQHPGSGRALISKGFLLKAQKVANKQVKIFSDLIDDSTYLIGIEPSAILSFRDEYLDLVNEDLLDKARALAERALTIEEFIAMQAEIGNITSDQFTTQAQHVMLHGHCQQKAWGLEKKVVAALNLPLNYTVETIASGCCGMAGSFGYEKEHFAISQKIANLVLYPAIASKPPSVIIAASGTSCRHQIKEGTDQSAVHPVEILFKALKD